MKESFTERQNGQRTDYKQQIIKERLMIIKLYKIWRNNKEIDNTDTYTYIYGNKSKAKFFDHRRRIC